MPVDRGALDAQLREIGEGERWWEQREFRDLPLIMASDERIHGLTVGKLLDRRRPRLPWSPRWLFVVTDQRLLCLKHDRFVRKHVDIVWSQIERVDQRSGFRDFHLSVATRERKYRLRIPKSEALRFTAALAPHISRSHVRHPPGAGSLGWIPGMNTVVALPLFAGVIEKVGMLSPPDYATRDDVEGLAATVERLQSDVGRLQQQVAFLEDLLQQRAESFLSRAEP
jgi:hypothetical protein